MNLRPRSSPPPLRTAFMVLLLGLVCSSAAMAGEGFTIRSTSDVVVMPVGSKDYVVIGSDPVIYPLNGPGVLYGWVRAGFADGETAPKVGTVTVTGVGGQTFDLPMTFKPSSKSSWGGGRTGTPSGGKKFEIQVPEGTWNAMFTGLLPTGGELVLRAMYDGPAQPKPKTSAGSKGSSKTKNPWRYRNSFGLEVIYDDNITTQVMRASMGSSRAASPPVCTSSDPSTICSWHRRSASARSASSGTSARRASSSG